ncbi:MAG: hypothetical protein D3913_16205, partial [Candidatus Electrothrix sp. LOE1_4_5]|nr:hypothetical protein [Candidatus Electrothrix gigas]
ATGIRCCDGSDPVVNTDCINVAALPGQLGGAAKGNALRGCGNRNDRLISGRQHFDRGGIGRRAARACGGDGVGGCC